MRLLLDENLPKRLKEDFKAYEVYTVREKKWNGTKNGELLQLMLKNEIDVFLTFDKNLQYQQNFSKYPITVIVLNAPINTYSELTKLSGKINEHLQSRSLLFDPVVISIV